VPITGVADLASDGDHRNAVHLRIGNRGDEVQRARTARCHANDGRGFAGRAGALALRFERAALLVAGQNRTNLVLKVRQRLVQRHAGTTGIREKSFPRHGLPATAPRHRRL